MSFLVKLDGEWYFMPSGLFEEENRKICKNNGFEIKEIH